MLIRLRFRVEGLGCSTRGHEWVFRRMWEPVVKAGRYCRREIEKTRPHYFGYGAWAQKSIALRATGFCKYFSLSTQWFFGVVYVLGPGAVFFLPCPLNPPLNCFHCHPVKIFSNDMHCVPPPNQSFLCVPCFFLGRNLRLGGFGNYMPPNEVEETPTGPIPSVFGATVFFCLNWFQERGYRGSFGRAHVSTSDWSLVSSLALWTSLTTRVLCEVLPGWLTRWVGRVREGIGLKWEDHIHIGLRWWVVLQFDRRRLTMSYPTTTTINRYEGAWKSI